MTIKIAFRVDCSVEIGTGHLMRCITLANTISKRGGSACFIIREPMPSTLECILQNGHVYKILSTNQSTPIINNDGLPHSNWLPVSQEFDALQTVDTIRGSDFDWIIVDHYALDDQWHRIIKQYCKKIFVIDDLMDRKIYASFVLNQNFGLTEHAYNLLKNKDCRSLLGPKYALLRPEFSNWRPFSLRRRLRPQLKRVLITMGGGDINDYTLKVLQSLYISKETLECEFIIVIGSHYSHNDSLETFIEKSPLKIMTCRDVKNMAEIMSNSDLCIGAAGATTWERCCLGLPSLVISIADNQQDILSNLKRYAIAIQISLENINSIFEHLHANFDSDQMKLMIKNMSSICDGKGAIRVTDRIFKT